MCWVSQAFSRCRYLDKYFTEICSGSEAGSYLRLIKFVRHSTLGLRVIKKKKYLNVEELGGDVVARVVALAPRFVALGALFIEVGHLLLLVSLRFLQRCTARKRFIER